MRMTLASESGLNAAACDRLLALITSEKARQSPEIIIDLHGAAYLDPYGAACLVLIARYLTKRAQPLVCILPGDARVQQQAAQFGLIRALRSHADVRNISAGFSPSSKDTTLTLSAIRSRADVQAVVAYLVELAESHLGYDLGDVLDATKVVSELCYNVVDHSDSDGLVAARIFHGKQGQRVVSLAVVDSGIGIRASLTRRFAEAAQWRHAEAIERALGGLSSRPTGGGIGLRSVQAVVRRYGGHLVIRSGTDRLFLAADRQLRTLPGTEFAGTQVGISFSQKV